MTTQRTMQDIERDLREAIEKSETLYHECMVAKEKIRKLQKLADNLEHKYHLQRQTIDGLVLEIKMDAICRTGEEMEKSKSKPRSNKEGT